MALIAIPSHRKRASMHDGACLLALAPWLEDQSLDTRGSMRCFTPQLCMADLHSGHRINSEYTLPCSFAIAPVSDRLSAREERLCTRDSSLYFGITQSRRFSPLRKISSGRSCSQPTLSSSACLAVRFGAPTICAGA